MPPASHRHSWSAALPRALALLWLGCAVGCGSDTLESAPAAEAVVGPDTTGDTVSAEDAPTALDDASPDAEVGATPDGQTDGAADPDTEVGATADARPHDAGPDDTNPFDSSAVDSVTPDTNALDSSAVDSETPDTTTFDSTAVDTATPDVGAPDANTPDANDPDTTSPDANAPDTDTPDANAPDTDTPDANDPDTDTPDANDPDTTSPYADVPDAGATDADAPDAGCPGAAGCPCIPAKEACNGVDDDCDGLTDEATCPAQGPCTTAACDGAAGVCKSAPLPNGVTCDADSDVCTQGDACQAGVCVAGGKLGCDDFNPCTQDSCAPTSGCQHAAANGAPCDDNDVCTVGDACKDNGCVAGLPKVCTGTTACLLASCKPTQGCVVAPRAAGTACSDGDACTAKDACAAGACAGAAVNCDDGNACTADACDAKLGCGHKPAPGPCDDGNACTTADPCQGSVCAAGKAVSCDDKAFCTVESCVPSKGCVVDKTSHHGLACDADGSLCTEADACNQGACEPGASLDCDDKNPCTADTCAASVGCKHSATADEQACGNGKSTWCKAGACVPKAPPVDALRDYGFWYWPGNHRPTETWPKVQPLMHVLTGHYGLAWNEATGALAHLGPVSDAKGAAAATHRSNATVSALPSASLAFEAGDAPAVATTFLGTKGATVDRAQMIDGGRLMNRLQIATVRYQGDTKLQGSVQLAAMPRHFTWVHTVKGSAAAKVARVRLGGAALAPYAQAEWLVPGRALRRTNAQGQGWVFVVANVQGQSLTVAADGSVVAQRTVGVVPLAGNTVAMTVVAAQAVNAAELAMYLQPDKAVALSYQLLNLKGQPVGSAANPKWDPSLGAYRVDLGSLKASGAPGKANFDQAAFHHWHGRHRLTVSRATPAPMAVPIALFGGGNVSWYITGGVPLWRDAAGHPTGTTVQISKNWHGQVWYHLYSQPTFRGPGPDTLELTVASSRWGLVYAASHAQLSLVGWGQAGGHWDESALGAFGESITYDPDVTLQRAMVDDVRPFLVQSKTKWSWTGNVGGADFLRYASAAKPFWERRLSRVRSHYAAPGPNLTDVTYAGVSSDQAIRATIRTQLVGTDDVVRAYYHLDYELLADVAYSRLAWFQVAADNYADNLFARYAWGNAAGTTADKATPNHKSKGYAKDADRGIALSGAAPWVLLYDNKRDWDKLPEHYASVGFVVRAFEATLGPGGLPSTTTLSTPHINISRTYNGKMSQMAFQLGMPHKQGAAWCGAPCGGKQRFLPKGTRVRATVEYLVLPADKSRYYGAAPWLKNMAPSVFDSPAQMRLAAAGNHYQVQAHAGTLRRLHPVEVDAAAKPVGGVAVDLTLQGGLGFVPLSVRGLTRHDGWQLQRLQGGVWQAVKQAVHGNDAWQAMAVPETKTWTLTYSLPGNYGGAAQRYRVVTTKP